MNPPDIEAFTRRIVAGAAAQNKDKRTRAIACGKHLLDLQNNLAMGAAALGSLNEGFARSLLVEAQKALQAAIDELPKP